MGILSKIAQRLPRGLAVTMMGVGGLFGIRTPPDPPVTVQVTPAGGRKGDPSRTADFVRGARDDQPPDDARPMRRGPRTPRGPSPRHAVLPAVRAAPAARELSTGRRWPEEELPHSSWDLRKFSWFPDAGLFVN